MWVLVFIITHLGLVGPRPCAQDPTLSLPSTSCPLSPPVPLVFSVLLLCQVVSVYTTVPITTHRPDDQCQWGPHTVHGCTPESFKRFGSILIPPFRRQSSGEDGPRSPDLENPCDPCATPASRRKSGCCACAIWASAVHFFADRIPYSNRFHVVCWVCLPLTSGSGAGHSHGAGCGLGMGQGAAPQLYAEPPSCSEAA